MKNTSINKEQLMPYIMGAFAGDDEILNYYDKNRSISDLMSVCYDVNKKLTEEWNNCILVGLEEDSKKIGYYAYVESEKLLISFGINRDYRKRDYLVGLWEMIKDDLGNEFRTMMYSYNKRGISWLEKCGMDVLFDSVTILTFSEN